MLVLACLSAGLLIMASLLGFGLVGVYLQHNYHEQPLRAAALSAAASLGQVVINDPNFGYLGLIDRPPIGGSLVAKDNYALPVRGINSLASTIRLDMIIADALGDKTLKTLAQDDYKNFLTASNNLKIALASAVAPNARSKPTDIYGKKVDAFGDALAIYLSNGGIVVDKSAFAISLGSATGLSSNVPLPVPSTYAYATAEQEVNSNYAAFVSIPYSSQNFVFTALATNPTLIESSTFATVVAGTPVVIPDVVKVEGIISGAGQERLIGSACAVPGATLVNPLSAGVFALTFPDGNIPELTSFGQIFRDQVCADISFISGAVTGGDYPGGSASIVAPGGPTPSWLGNYLNGTDLFSLLLYDWIRRAGPSLRVDSLLNAMQAPISPSPNVLSPYMVALSIGTDGNVSTSFLQLEQHYAQSSDSQLVAGIAVKNLNGLDDQCIYSPSRVQLYDVQVCDNVRQPGATHGGLHGGEPLTDPRLTSNPPFPDPNYQDPTNENTGQANICPRAGWAGKSGGWAFLEWKVPNCYVAEGLTGVLNWPYPLMGGDNTPEQLTPQPKATSVGAARPSYSTPGLAVEIAFHRYIWANPRTSN
jgi:hypothetical protein